MFDLTRYSARLRRADDGIWYAPGTRAVSYPADGNAHCLALERTSFWFAHRNRCLVEAIGRFPPSGVLLDVGAGNGFVDLALNRAGYATIVLEAGPEGARNARARGLDPVACSTLEDAGFRDASVAAVGLFDVLEHVEDDVGFLAELRRIVEPGGNLYVTVPAGRWLHSHDDVLAGHFRRYTARSLAAALDASGFEVLWSTRFFAPLVLPLFLFRVVPSRLGWSRKAPEARHAREHAPKRGPHGRALAALLDAESKRIRDGRVVGTGTSCLAVARAR